MKITECKVGLRVTDSWFPGWGIGKIVEVLKTRVKIRYVMDEGGPPITYDKAHIQFLRRSACARSTTRSRA